MKNSPFVSSFAVFVMAVSTFCASNARAGNTWDGGGTDSNWNTANNWNPDGTPGYGTVTFSGTTRTNPVLDVNYNMNQVNFASGGPWTLVGGAGTLSLFDFGGGQAKVENNGTSVVGISASITFAANNGSPPNPFGEINAVNGDLLFSGGTLTVNGSSCNGIKLFGGSHVVTFNNTVSASGKWFGITTSGTGNTINIGGAFTCSDFYMMNDGTLNLNSGGTLSGKVRLGGDFGNTGNQNQTKSGTFNLTSTTGGQTFSDVVNSVTGNTSGTLAVNSQNTSGANTLSGHIALDSNLKITQAAGGTLNITQTKGGDNTTATDIKGLTLTLTPAAGGTIVHSGTIYNSTGTGGVTMNGAGTVIYSAAHTYTGDTLINAGTLQISSGGSANSSIIRIGDTSGTASATLSAGAGASFGSTTVVRSGSSGLKAIASTATTGTATLSGGLFLDADVTVTNDSGGTLVFSGATLDLKNQTMTVNNAGTVNMSGVLQQSTGSGKLTKTANGTLVLSNNNTYTGATTINGGTVRVTGQTGLGSGTGTGNVAVNAGGKLSGNGRIGSAVTVANSATAVLYPNSGTTLTISNNVTFSGSSSVAKFDLSSSTGGANDKVVLVNNTLTCGGATVSINLTNASLSASDYVLFDVGASGTISGSFNSTPTWSGTTPKYASGYSIVTLGKTVVLRYTPIAITVTAAANTKTYDGTNTAAATPTVTSGSLESGDTGNFTEVYDNRNIGSGKTLTPSGTVSAAGPVDVTSRYNINFATATTGTINARAITVTAATDTKSYDGTTNSTGTPTITSGSLASGDSVTWSQSFDSPNVGSRTLTPAGTVNDGNSGNNYSVTYATASGSITAASTSLSLTTSTNLSQLNSNVTFTATVSPALATGDVVFKSGATPFGTNALADGVATFSTSALAGGTNTITAEYAGDGNVTGSTNSLSQIVNRPPAVSNLTTSVAPSDSIALEVIGGKHAATDPDGDSLTLDSVSPTTTTNGGSIVIVGGTNVVYTATNNWSGTDAFNYTVSDGRGGIATATVTVTVLAPAGGANITGLGVSGGDVIVTAQGVVNATYSLQYTDSLSPINWQDAGATNVASGLGTISLTNSPATLPPSRYYRTKYVSGP